MTLRYGLAAPAQHTTVRQGNGGFFGGLMKGFCFVAVLKLPHQKVAKQSKHLVNGDKVSHAVNDV